MRPGVSAEEARAARAELSSSNRILFFDMPPIPVSSSAIRERVARGESIEGLVPTRVADAVVRLRLYAEAE
jgi:nicotinic acid mononucleotide adenylyltransferase